MIQFDNVVREFGEFHALKSLCLTVQEGSIYTLLGHNGAGKTTALRIAIGLILPTSGRVLLTDVDVEQDPIRAKEVAGFLPDTPSYFHHLTGESFLEFLARARGLHEDRWRPRRDDLLERLGLSDARHSRLATYSFGMLRKTALAGALLHSPPHLLLDEPTAGLDPWSVRALKDIMLEEAARGASLLISSHDLDAVAEVSDRVGIIKGGILLKEVASSELPHHREGGNTELERIFLEVTRDGGDGSKDVEIDGETHLR